MSTKSLKELSASIASKFAAMSADSDRKPKRTSLLPKEKKQREKPINIAENSDSEDEPLKNRIGNVPIEWYANEDHIGYDVYGKAIMRKDHGDSIDAFLARTDDPNAGYVGALLARCSNRTFSNVLG